MVAGFRVSGQLIVDDRKEKITPLDFHKTSIDDLRTDLRLSARISNRFSTECFYKVPSESTTTCTK